MKILIISMMLLGFIVNAEAAGQYNSITIDNVTIVDDGNGGGVARVTGSSGIKLTETSCSNTGDSTSAQFAFKIETEVGKSWLSLVMTALVAGNKVHLLGSNQCLSWEGMSYEKLRNLYLLK